MIDYSEFLAGLRWQYDNGMGVTLDREDLGILLQYIKDHGQPGEKTALTFDEKITCSYLHYVCGVQQQHLCIAFRVNIGRVSEAVTTLRKAYGVPDTPDRPQPSFL